MKKVIFLLFLALNAALTFAQTQVVEGKTSSTTCHRMTVSYQGKIAYVRRESIPFSTSINSKVSDLANLGTVNGRYIIPNDGSKYWLVPFENRSIIETPSGSLCPECVCKEGQTGTCGQAGPFDCTGTCKDCEMDINVCDGDVLYRGSVAIIKASQIVFN